MNAPIPSGFDSLLDYAVAMMDYGDDPVERMYNRDRASKDLAHLRAVKVAARRLLDVLPVRYDRGKFAGYELPALPPDDAIRQYRALRDALEAKP